MARRSPLLVVLVVAGLLIGLLTPSRGASATTPAPVPTLDWTDCGDGFLCATATVPLDHARQRGATIELALIKSPAVDPANRLGTLFLNPGGPGGSGVDFVRSAPPAAFPAVSRYDVVGFDPRGVGASRPAIDCGVDQEREGLFAQPFLFPDTLDEADWVRRSAAFTARCVARNARILPYVSTADVARDLDLLRQAVGDERLTYLGLSYGTLLGATYASLFPASTGRMVLDGAFDAQLATNDGLETGVQQTVAQEDALARFFAACAADQQACAGFGGNDPDAAWFALVASLDEQPVPAPNASNPQPVDGDDARATTAQALFARPFWPLLAAGLAQASAGDGSLLRFLADGWYARNPDGSDTPLYDQFFAVNAADQSRPRGVLPYLAAGRRAAEQFPHFSWTTGYVGLPYGLNPIRARAPYRGPYDPPPDAPTTLVVGTTHDSATPYVWAERLTADLGNARLLTMDGDGHTAFFRGSPCIDAAIVAYLNQGALPAAGTVCPQQVPFAAPAPPPGP